MCRVSYLRNLSSALDQSADKAHHEDMTENNQCPTLMVHSAPVPVRFSPEGCAYVSDTRVPLETVVFYFNQGSTPEEIVQDFPSLNLVDVYGVLTYYLNDREAADSYLADFRQRFDSVREKVRAKSDTGSIRERLLARRKSSA